MYVWITSLFPHRSIPRTTTQFSSIFDYRLHALISAQFHFTIWQLRCLCHLDLSGSSISSTGNLHVCISLWSFVRQRQKCQDGGRGGDFSAQISFHLWCKSAALTRVKLAFSERRFFFFIFIFFLGELWIWNTVTWKGHLCNSFIHSVIHPLQHEHFQTCLRYTLRHTWQQ